MLAAFRILNSSKSDFYDILGLEPFSPLTSIKAQYKKLALLLQDKNTLKHASEEAFKLVNDAFHILSDRFRRREYDTKLRLALQEEEEEEREDGSVEGTFWTACSRCRLMHKFERKYVGHSLVCPNCNRSFEAVEVSNSNDDGNDEARDESSVRRSSRVRVRVRKFDFGEESRDLEMGGGNQGEGRVKLRRGEILVFQRRSKIGDEKVVESDEGRPKIGSEKIEGGKKGESMIEEVETGSVRPKRVKSDDQELTLAELRLEALRKKKSKKESEKKVTVRKENELQKMERRKLVENGDMEVMAVEDSDFYDFDKDRVERSFKKGQVWAIYDDDDGMPRHYGLIDEVVSVNPFEVKMSWLDFQNCGDERLICLEKMGFHISCGRFKVARKDTIKLLNIFSHIVECERAARELYRIYPRKSSIWALYNESSLDKEGRNSSSRSRRHYDIVVFLTSYSEMHGLSLAYLEKVEGYRAVFKRREIGYHAVRWLEKDDIRLFSHQIPARKLSSDDAPDLSGDCWELDPASLPPDLLTLRG